MESSFHFRFGILVPLLLLSLYSSSASAGVVGVCYGRNGNNLPTPLQAVAVCKEKGISKVRIFDADSDVIKSFADSGIALSITISNLDITGIALDQNVADAWLLANVLPYVPATTISAISVGTEVMMTNAGNLSSFLVPAMRNIYTALKTKKLDTSIQVVSPNSMTVLTKSYPPSAGTFDPAITNTIVVPMLTFLSQTRSPFMLNSYPYYAYVNDPKGVPLDYALFTSSVGVIDSNNQLHYTNLFDAQVDAVYAAMAALNFSDISIVVAETGWPNKGDSKESAASAKNAETFNQNLINEVVRDQSGTPLKPEQQMEAYIFSLYNENQKADPESERNFGIFYADGEEVYPLNFFGGTGGSGAVQNRTWCVARNDASNNSLRLAIDFACGPGHSNCDAIQEGGACYEPNTYVNHASYAFNDYFQKSNMDPRACNFSGTANLTQRDPMAYGSDQPSVDNPFLTTIVPNVIHTLRELSSNGSAISAAGSGYGSCVFYARVPSLGYLLAPHVYYGVTALLALALLLAFRG